MPPPDQTRALPDQSNVERAFRTRRHACSCPQPIPGVTRGRTDSSCPRHGWDGDSVAEEGRSIVENDAIQAEHAALDQERAK